MPGPEAQRQPYRGSKRGLVIAFDIGTTFSGVSYAILEPNQVPKIHGVTQYPGQVNGGDSKIPSIVCYDATGKVFAVGAETDPDINPDLLDQEGIKRAEWFKLHIRLPHLNQEQNFTLEQMPKLPPKKTAIDVYGDLLAYLYQATKTYICQRQGSDIWDAVVTNAEYILTHPNGWEGKQQSELRRAARLAGLVKRASSSDALKRVHFVTEGEASLHFCLNKVPTVLDQYGKDGVMVVDAGGGTIDISTYTSIAKNKFKEIAPTECLYQGSAFVTRRATFFLQGFLTPSKKFGTPDIIETMTGFFNRTTKTSFKSPSKTYFIRFGRVSDNDSEYGIKAGSLRLSGHEIAGFFEPAIKGIIEAIESQSKNATKPIKAVFLVGGFSTSDYLFSRLEDHFESRNIKILRPDAYLNKAVPEGAVSYHLDHCVTSRMSKFSYGIRADEIYDPKNAEHRARESKVICKPNGERRVPDGFTTILAKAVEVSETKEFRKPFQRRFDQQAFDDFKIQYNTIRCYRGEDNKAPHWLDEAPEKFDSLCRISADMTPVKNSITPQYKGSTPYYTLKFNVILLFGLTEFRAQIAWKENGVEKRGPASIIYDFRDEKHEEIPPGAPPV
ncbi:hypothetical protein AMATHDRAFT_5370 [Amanita thiersii Skay4041]|uniref:Uncharacterized protein n=1 Tax=Amanita thiersii Skay4041 TaxID=703135 RepID=A0A2A9NFP6_9AGAR|nr:hypothetical protein AMATHDRAFT_5370 [Amanita thiersii Skay4041]